jgi:curved DNA-binding protein CbpA
LKTHYQLLGVEATASADEIKRSFRREIARYHPDKVQHLGSEFQDIAATRASELTEAYRVLMDAEQRRQYDEALAEGGGAAGPPDARTEPPRTAPQEAAAPPRPSPSEEPSSPPPPDRRFRQERATTSDFVRKAALGKLRAAIGSVPGTASDISVAGFDAAFVIKPPRSLFKKPEPQVRLLARFVSQVDGQAVDEAWSLAARSGAFDGVVCLLLLGTDGLAPQKDLAHAVSERRRKARNAGPILVPVDVRDWEALFPPEAPPSVRTVIQQLRAGKV